MTVAMNRILNMATLCLAVALVAGLVMPRSKSGTRPQGGPAVEDVAGLETTLDPGVKGQGTGPIAVVEFSDFECPFCGLYARGETYRAVKREYVETNRITYLFRQFPLQSIHPKALGAALASECAAQQRLFWPMHDLLFAHQARLISRDLVDHALAAGANGVAFTACMSGDVSEQVRRDQDEGRRLGVRTTPTFFVGLVRDDRRGVRVVKRLQGVQPLDVLQSVIEEVIGSQTSIDNGS